MFIAQSSQKRIAKMLAGKNSKDIDDVLLQIYKNISVLDQFRSKATTEIQVMNGKIARSVQSIETIRFNPFKGTGSGGNQSFASAMLDEKGDGMILSSLYSSDRMSVFAKPVQAFSSTFELTEEEKEALTRATQKVQK